MAEFFAELKRRQMFRVAAAYAVVAWLLLQIVNNVAPILDLPPWVARAFLLALVIGFPIALLFVWMRDLAPADGAAPKAATTKLDYVLAGALIAVIGLLSYEEFASSPPGPSAQRSDSAQSAAAGMSIAVLPFANLSGDAAQEFFSDGTSEEITAALAKIPGLRVVGRSSAFQFKGQSRDLRAIGEALSARYLIDGSVRMAGNRVRITAQLIQADDGIGLWTENYDRELTDIFAIQEDIAQAIASALRVPLGLAQGEQLVPNRSINPETYQQYLRAKALIRARGLRGLTEAVVQLEQIAARDPNYGPTWALLGLAHSLTPNFHPAWTGGAIEEARRVIDASLSKGEGAAQRSIQLDANHADGYVALGFVQEARGRLLQAEELYAKAFALDANNPDALNFQAQLLAKVGRLRESLETRQRLQVLEPFVPLFNNNTAGVLWLNGQTDAAVTMLRAAPPNARAFDLARIYASMGRYDEAADTLLDLPTGPDAPQGSDAPGTIEEAIRLLRSRTNSATAPASPRLGRLGFVYVYVGDPEQVLEFYEDNAASGYFSSAALSRVWHPSYAPARRSERFKALMRRAGLVDYWRARGWPDLCRPVGADDFECE
jgi:TolB-like protein